MSTEVRTHAGQDVALDDAAVADLRGRFRGAVIEPSDEAYDEARAPHNAIFDKRPGLIIRCTGTADVIDAVGLAREHDLLTAVRCGSHSIAGHSTCEGGLLIDLSLMRGVRFDPRTQTVIAQGGATWGDVDRETQAFGRAVPGGIISTTGVGGLTLGGGIGWIHRAFGLACDSLLGADVVTASGELVHASAEEEPDLFWALRGGGGNFGVVTSFEYATHPVGPDVFQAAPVYALADGADVLKRWAQWCRTASDAVTTRALFWTLPDVEELPEPVRGQDVLILAAVHAGTAEEGERELQPLREMGPVLGDLSMAMPYRTAQSGFDPFFAKGSMRSYWKSLYVDDLDDAAIELVVRQATDRPHPLTLLHIPLMGGATGRVPADATAFGDRSAAFMYSIDGNWADAAQDEEVVAWVRSAIAEIERLPSARGSYLNFSGDGEIGHAERAAAFGANLARLTAVKDRYDPRNLFRLNNNIPTSAGDLPGQRASEEAVDVRGTPVTSG